MLIEFIKEFYMNYPLKNLHPSILCSDINENKFILLNDPKNTSESELVTTSPIKENETDKSKDDIKIETENNDRFIYISKRNLNKSPKTETRYLSYKNEAIISLIKSDYMKSKIIIRDFTGMHAWLITNDNLNTNTKDKNEADKFTSLSMKKNNSVKIDKSLLEIDKKSIEERIKRNEENDILTKAISILCKNCQEAQEVSFIFNW